MLKSNIRVGDLLMTDVAPLDEYVEEGEQLTNPRWTRSVLVVSLDEDEHDLPFPSPTRKVEYVIVLDRDRTWLIATHDLWRHGPHEQRHGYN